MPRDLKTEIAEIEKEIAETHKLLTNLITKKIPSSPNEPEINLYNIIDYIKDYTINTILMNIYGIYAQKKDSKKISKNIIKSDDFIRILKANIILHIKITKLASDYLDENKAIETINRTFFLAKFMKIKDIENKLEKLIKLKTKLSNYISKYNDLIREDWIKKTEEKIIILKENITDNNLNGNIKNIFLMFEKCKENMDKLKKILSEHNNFIGECNTIKIPKVYQTIFEQTYNALATVYPEYDVPSNSSAPNTLASIIKGIFEKITSNPKSEFQEAIELWKNDPNILEIKLNNKEPVLPSGGALKFNFNIGSYKKQHIILTRKPNSVTKTTIETDDNDTSNIKIYKKLIE